MGAMAVRSDGAFAVTADLGGTIAFFPPGMTDPRFLYLPDPDDSSTSMMFDQSGENLVLNRRRSFSSDVPGSVYVWKLHAARNLEDLTNSELIRRVCGELKFLAGDVAADFDELEWTQWFGTETKTPVCPG
jgi:hypothetical protein